jgi:anti-sigma factor RsiW
MPSSRKAVGEVADQEDHLLPASVWDYLDQAVSPEDQAKIEQHLSFCRRCCGELEFATQLRGFLASQSAEELPSHVKARLERFLADL